MGTVGHPGLPGQVALLDLGSGEAGAASSLPELAAALRAWLREHERRTGRALSRRQLAGALNVSVRSVYAYLSGTTLIPDPVLSRLLTQLDVPGPAAGALLRARDRVEMSRRQTARPVVRELPPLAAGFTGRAGPAGELDQLRAARRAAGCPGLCVLDGVAGAGKTALALAWAHRSRARFPDGCLFVDLRGYDPRQPLDPHEALGILLRSLGLADAELPGRLTARMSRYRTLADGKRMLIVLDNAFSADQVRPLLPGALGCFVVVTSRDDLGGLVARDGAHRITLGPLTETEGAQLLEVLLGRRRVQAERQEAQALADACERLPLAIRLAAEVAASRPDEPLAAIAADIGDRRLAALAGGGDERADLRVVLSWSYRRLVASHPAAARAFRLLGIHPGPDFDPPGVAALLGVTSGDAASLIGVLVRGHLVEPRPGTPRRFRMHDLLRAYAAELSAGCDDGPVRTASLTRLAGYYTLAAERAARCLASAANGTATAAEPEDAAAPGFTGAGPARSWLDAQRPSLVAVAVAAADLGLGSYASRLSVALQAYLDFSARYNDALTVHTCALRAGDATARAAARARLAAACLRLGRMDEGLAHAREALAAAQAVNDHPTLVSARQWLGVAHARLGHNETAAEHFRIALAVARQAGDRLTEGRLTGCLAIVHAQQRRYGQALEHGLSALTLARELGDGPGEGRALCNIGDICRLAGDYREALAYGQQAQVIAAEISDRSAQATIAINLAVTCMHLGRYPQAHDYYRQAMTGARDVGNRELETRARAGLQEAAGRADGPGPGG